jgi:hypothetical protein
MAGDPADLAAADPIGYHHGDALQAQQRLFGNQYAVEILIHLLSAFIRVLTDRYRKLAWHAVTKNRASTRMG